MNSTCPMTPWLVRFALACAAGASATPAFAQCDVRWSSEFALDGFDGPLHAATAFDIDGPGPQGPRLIVAGSFGSVRGRAASGVGLLGADGWSSLANAANFASCWEFTRFDPDGAGPEVEQLVAAATASGLAGFGIFGFNPVTGVWTQIAPGVTFESVLSLASFDADGDGPQATMLLVGGSRSDGTTTTNGVHRVAPGGYQFVGDNPNDFQTRAMAAFDDDGPGPLPPRLWVAGFFARDNAASIHLRSWNGATWTNELTDADGPIGLFSLTLLDADGEGGDGPSLYLGGSFNRLGSVTARNLARRVGGAWQAVGTDLPLTASHVAAADPDGAGPLPRTLFVATLGAPPFASASNVYGLDQATGTWRPTPVVDGTISGLVGADPDGAGPREERLVVVGEFASVAGVPMSSIAAFDGRHWSPLESFANLGAYRNPTVFAMHDDDGPGPIQPALYAGGGFLAIGGNPARGLARYDGRAWTAEPGIVASSIRAIVEFDPDGDGPLPVGLAVGGVGITPAGQSATGVAFRGPNGWTRLASGPGVSNTTINALAVFDEDGTGPNPPRLFAAGDFFVIRNGVTLRGIGRWNGTLWEPVASGIGGTVNALTVFDDDGAGPRGPALYAGGSFASAITVTTGAVARWDGTAWSASVTDANNRPNSSVQRLFVFDPDGIGPRLPALFASGSFTFDLAGQRYRDIGRLESSAWRPVGVQTGPGGFTALTGNAGAMVTMDLDDAGPNPPSLVLAGSFSFLPPPSGQSSGQRLARWDAALDRWQPLPFNTVSGTVDAMAVVPFPQGASSLYVSGRFRTAGANAQGVGVSSYNLARYGPGLDVGIVEQPGDHDVTEGDTLVLRGRAVSANAVAHQWCLDGEPLADGPHATGMTVAGSVTNTLTITAMTPASAGAYRVTFTTPCGNVMSRASTVSVRCLADFDHSSTIDPDDLADMIACYFQPEPCLRADFDRSGTIDPDDLSMFIARFFEPCE